MSDDGYKHIGVQVSSKLHYDLKRMALEQRTSVKDLVVPLIRKLVDDWKKGKEGDDSYEG